MNYDFIAIIVIFLFSVQLLRRLLFGGKTLFTARHNCVSGPLPCKVLNSAFHQGFWMGLLIFFVGTCFFWPDLETAYILVWSLAWALVSAWIAVIWDRFVCRGRQASTKHEYKAHISEDPDETKDSPFHDTVCLLECNIDDMSGEFFGDLLDRLFSAGAVDVWFTPVYGKKNRPLYQISALTPIEAEEGCIRVIFEHSTTGGLRRQLIHRVVMGKSFVYVQVCGETVAVKKLQYKDIVKYSPEWEDCAAVSKTLGATAADIYAEALVSARKADGTQ